MTDFEVQDCNGKKLSTGDIVLYGIDTRCRVVEISEPDGDYDDELGRAVEIPPGVMVRGIDDELFVYDVRTTNDTKVSWADYPDGPDFYTYVAEDLELI